MKKKIRGNDSWYRNKLLIYMFGSKMKIRVIVYLLLFKVILLSKFWSSGGNLVGSPLSLKFNLH